MNPKIFRSLLLLSSIALVITSCKTRNNQPMAQEPVPVPPAGYGEGAPANGDGGIPLPPEQQQGGRFGYSGTDAPAPPEPPKPADPAKPGVRDVRDMKPSGSSSSNAPAPPEKKPEKKPTSSTKAPSSSEMPYANPVPGNPLVVTLPGSNASLGKISIEKYDSSLNPTGEPLKRGTQVQIPDPNNPGKKIFFKVP